MTAAMEIYRPVNPVRVVTATSLFDGHDASINIFRRILQDAGVEVIHLGHNRSVMEIVDAAVEEDVQGVAVSSYQGGHVEFFKYLIDLLRKAGASHIRVFGGGGGVIIPEEIRELEAYGVTKIYSPEDGARMGLQGIIDHMVREMDYSRVVQDGPALDQLSPANKLQVANLITVVEQAKAAENGHLAKLRAELKRRIADRKVPVIGITGTGGSGKSSLTDELILRLMHDFKHLQVAVISADPSRRKTGGALLGDRIRMNAIGNPRIYMRSLATRRSHTEIPDALVDAIDVAKAAGYDLVIAETAGIGQGDSHIIDIVDLSIYVMTSEFGAASQLEKIDMLDFADLVVVNKFEKRGGEDAIRDVCKQVQRNRTAFDQPPEQMPVYGTIASKFNDDGVNALYHGLLDTIKAKTGVVLESNLPRPVQKTSSSKTIIIPPARIRYLAEIAETMRTYHRDTDAQTAAVRRVWHLEEAVRALGRKGLDGDRETLLGHLKSEVESARQDLAPETVRLIEGWPETKARYQQDDLVYQVRGREIRVPLHTESLSRKKIPKIALPPFTAPGEIYRWLRRENLPGYFPYTAGVFPMKRTGEDPTRMFAGEGDPARTNRRFRLLSANSEAKRLSTAFDSVTLYGYDPDQRPDIYGKIGNSGVSVCTLDDVKVLYGGFDLCAPGTSVSMTINGPAPILLAQFLNTAIDQQVDTFKAENGRDPDGNEYAAIRARTLSTVRGTVQADILKEDQGQNTCIFSIDFALKMMGDIQAWFIDHNVRNFYSVSISGYHIAEAGANPISQLAFTLANGFTYLEYYLSRHAPGQLRAQSLLFLLQRPGPGVHGHRPRGAAHLGRGPARQVRRQHPVADAQVPYPDVGPLPAQPGYPVQRYPHHPAGPVRHLRQLPEPAHQRLRRSHHHPHRGVGAPGPGHPADHQPRMGAGQKRESAAGQFHRGRIDRPGGRGRSGAVRPDHRARRRPGRHGDRLPAQQDPGRVHPLRSAQAHRGAAHHRRQYLPRPPCRRRRVQRNHRCHRSGPLHGGRKRIPAGAAGRIP
jgi:methylmalonyl-CoA mutase